jgi:hypothetical protein
VTSLRESPIRRQKPSRPAWMLPLLVVVGVLVLLAIGFGILTLVRGSSDGSSEDASAATPAPCETTTVEAGTLLPLPAKVKVNVYNATSTAGLASKTATAVEKQGFRIGEVANDPVDKPITGVAQIRYGPKGAQGAELMLAYVPGAELVALERKGRAVDLAVGDAFTGLASEEAVAATLAEPTTIVTGPGCSTGTPAP